ncbi:sensor histidine kinase [Halalkalibacter urbisdiaboli]|uniref:sensor histidine kinase n=1 Tax=Halalkalibacter urbisdiaboli TaxID=1960589 RepID=UPI000B43A63D|nr:sensor histidine kinase [Halalkalibacter urbisdiaboli]
MESHAVSKRVTSYIIQAQEEENKRIANELHDGIAQTLFSIFTGLQIIESGVEQKEIKKFTRELRQQTERTIEELRWLSTEIYPLSLKKLGLVSALKSYLKIYTSTFGIMTQVETVGEELSLSEEVNITLFRVLQETLNNTARYADASQVRLAFRWESDRLHISIEDEGIGFDLEEVFASGNHLGLDSMKQRVELFSGTFHIYSEKEKGCRTDIYVPLVK